jgi:polysaccharide export outer membrane protein
MKDLTRAPAGRVAVQARAVLLAVLTALLLPFGASLAQAPQPGPGAVAAAVQKIPAPAPAAADATAQVAATPAPDPDAVPTLYSDAPAGAETTLSPGDALEITVKGEPTFTGVAVVAADGRATLQHIGALTASGLTVKAFAQSVAKSLVDQQFLRSPAVRVGLVNLRLVTVEGEVARPGKVRYEPGMDAIAAAGAAGGLTPFADQSRIAIVRDGAGEQVYGLSSPALLAPNDVVRFMRASITIGGDVQTPGELPFQPGMTLGAALDAAGGLSRRGVRGSVTIQHAGVSEPRVYRLSRGLELRSGDVIRIEARLF